MDVDWELRRKTAKECPKWGFTGVDTATCGLWPGQMWIIGGRPGEGKTTLALRLALSWAENNHKIVFFSNEMLKQSLHDQMAGLHFGISRFRIRTGEISEEEKCDCESFYSYLKTIPLKIYDNFEGTDMAAMMAILHEEKPTIAIVDHLQMIRGMGAFNNKKRHEEIENILLAFKEYVMKQKTSVLLLSQTNRDTDDRPLGLPLRSDLKDSGAIEQLADGILLVAWPWKRQSVSAKPLTFKDDAGENVVFTENNYLIYLAKNRYGEDGQKFRVRFEPKHGYFCDEPLR